MPLVVHQGIPSSLFILGVCVCARASMHSCMPGCWEKHRIKKDGLGNGEVWEEAGKLRKGLLSCQQRAKPLGSGTKQESQTLLPAQDWFDFHSISKRPFSEDE